MTIATIILIFGLALLFWAITASGAHPARRATGAGVGIAALLIALLLGSSEDRHDWRDRS